MMFVSRTVFREVEFGLARGSGQRLMSTFRRSRNVIMLLGSCGFGSVVTKVICDGQASESGSGG